MAGIGEAAWELYQASPPALLALLTLLVGVGGRYAFSELQALEDTVDGVEDRVNDHELLLDHHETRLEQAREAQRRNDRRIQELQQQQAAAHGFDARATPAETAEHDPDRSDTAEEGDL
jgi:TolA-binding protein